MAKPACLVIGAGWAGLSAALDLAYNYNVTLLESAPNPGGRARGISHKLTTCLDNGQHLLLNCCTTVLEILNQIDIDYKTCFNIFNWDFNIIDFNNPQKKVLSIIDKIKLNFFINNLKKIDLANLVDINTLEFLVKYKQSLNLINNFWQPLILAGMSTSINQASSKVFFNMFIRLLSKNNRKLLIAKNNLSEIFGLPAVKKLKQLGAGIYYNTRVKELIWDNNICLGAKTDNTTFRADYIIVATSVNAAAKLLSNNPQTELIANKLNTVNIEAITTIYFIFAPDINFKNILPPLTGVINSIIQWIFARDNILSIVINNNINNINKNINNNIINLVYKQLLAVYKLPPYMAAKVICEKQAAFSCSPEFNKIRPNNNIKANLYLAGDYTNTGYPATLEGAVISGKSCASLVKEFISSV